MRAASLLGPKQTMPAVRTASATPSTSGTSGTDDHQVGADLARQGDDVFRRGDIDLVLVGQPGGAGVAGSDRQPRDLGVFAKRQQQRMLTGTGTNHQDAHDTSD